MVIKMNDEKFESWYNLPKEKLDKLKKYPELEFLRHQGKWRVKSNGTIELRTSQVFYDTTMGAIHSLLLQNWRVYVSPSATQLVVGFLQPCNDPDFPMWTREEIINKR